MHGLIGGRWPSEQPDETHEKPKGQRAVPPGTPTNQRPTSPMRPVEPAPTVAILRGNDGDGGLGGQNSNSSLATPQTTCHRQ